MPTHSLPGCPIFVLIGLISVISAVVIFKLLPRKSDVPSQAISQNNGTHDKSKQPVPQQAVTTPETKTNKVANNDPVGVSDPCLPNVAPNIKIIDTDFEFVNFDDFELNYFYFARIYNQNGNATFQAYRGDWPKSGIGCSKFTPIMNQSILTMEGKPYKFKDSAMIHTSYNKESHTVYFTYIDSSFSLEYCSGYYYDENYGSFAQICGGE